MKENNEENQLMTKSNGNKGLILLIILVALILFGMIFSTVFALININNKTIMNGTYIEGIDVSNLSVEEATQKVNDEITNIINSDIKLKYNEDEYILKINELKPQFDTKKAIIEAYEIGRKKNIIENNYQILFTNIFKKKVEINYNIDESASTKILENIESKLEGVVEQSSYYIDGENLVVTKGKDGIIITKETVISKLKENINDKLNGINNEEIPIAVQTAKPNAIDVEKIQKGIYKTPQDAYYTQNPFKIYPESDGIDFAVTIEEAQNIVLEDKEEYRIPLKYTKPNITVDQISTSAFPDTISTFLTKFDGSSYARTTNIGLVAEAINGKVVLPGEVFSFNSVVGNTTKEKGYQLATSYINGKMAQDYGGGTCQVSTTLYNAVLRANLEVVERRNHSYIVSYVDIGTDATIAYPTTDFKFKNNRNYAIKIIANAKNGILQVDLLGVKEETEYEVIIDSKVTQVIPYTTKTTKVNNLASGAQRVVVNGVNGYKSVTYKTLKQNGEIISKEIISEDTYKAMPREIEIGR